MAAFLEAGGSWVWFRDRDLPPAERRRLGERVAARVFAEGGTLTVGGDIDLAADLGADGVHLGGGSGAIPDRVGRARERLGAHALIGLSAHSIAEAAAAAAGGADYATLSPIFASASKPGYGPALGLEALRAGAAHLSTVALGGVTASTVGPCRAAGAAACAVMGAVMAAADPHAETARLLQAWHSAS